MQRKFHFNLTKFSDFAKMSDFHKIFNLLGHPGKIFLIFYILQVFKAIKAKTERDVIFLKLSKKNLRKNTGDKNELELQNFCELG